MLKILPFDTDYVLALAVDGPISGEDVKTVVDAVEDRLERHDSLQVYVELHNLGGVSVRSMLQDLKRALKHWRRFSRFALVTDNRWLAKGGPLINRLFSGVELGIYPFAEQTNATAWIKQQPGSA